MNTSSSSSTTPRFIDSGLIELVQVIGTGAYGVVYLGVDIRYEVPVYRAVKCLKRDGLDARQRHFQQREIALHRLASHHPSIVTMDRIVEEGEFLYVVMDYGDEGDLFAMITDQQRYVGMDTLIKSVFLQLLDGIAWLHSLGIAHRDIKPENIVCSEGGQRVRIVDFGLATSETISSEFGCGSTFYIAPECLGDWFPEKTQYPTRQGDVWSLGVILVNLVCGRNPWRIASPSDESFNAFLADPTFLRRILPVSNQCLSILQQIFTIDPSQRISLQHLRRLILQVDSFTMGEDELCARHLAAQPEPIAQVVEALPQVNDDWADESVFIFDDNQTPSLRADSGSPSPPTHRSRSTSSNGASLPPTPLLGGDETSLPAFSNALPLWELFKQPPRSRNEHYIPPSPDVVSAGTPINPFFR
ncbi:hypothetical protein P7C73_g4375, partial [Tremellales sp. Uapishka_1]